MAFIPFMAVTGYGFSLGWKTRATRVCILRIYTIIVQNPWTIQGVNTFLWVQYEKQVFGWVLFFLFSRFSHGFRFNRVRCFVNNARSFSLEAYGTNLKHDHDGKGIFCGDMYRCLRGEKLCSRYTVRLKKKKKS